MFGEIFRFELRQQLRRPTCWFIFAAFGLLSFWETTSPALATLGAHGSVLRNAPLILAKLFAMLAILSPLAVGTFAATAALRDYDCRTAELLFSTPIGRRSYLGGRFAAAFVLGLLTMLACWLGAALGGFMPWPVPGQLGPADWAGYLWTFGVIVVPDVLFATALLFLVASATRSLLKTYVAVVLMVVLLLMSHQLMANAGGQSLGSVLDPYGYHTLDVVSRYWSSAQVNSQFPTLTGVLLYNRVLWCAVGLLLLAAVILLPLGRIGAGRRRVRRNVVEATDLVLATSTSMTVPVVSLRHDARAQIVQFWHWLIFDVNGALRSTPFLVILLFAVVLLAFNLAYAPRLDGAANYPLTFLVLPTIQSSFDWLLCITLVFFAGELVWRDRDLRVGETRDALPWPTWVAVAAKCCTLVAVVVVFLLCGALWGIGWQLTHGVTRIQPGLYLATLATMAVPYVLLAFLCLFVQVLCGNRFIGYALTVLWLVVSKIAAPLFGWNDHLVWYGTTSAAPYSDLNGYGGYLKATWWFDGYWLAAALVLLLVAGLFWIRGVRESWRIRLWVGVASTRGPAATVLVLAILVFAGRVSVILCLSQLGFSCQG